MPFHLSCVRSLAGRTFTDCVWLWKFLEGREEERESEREREGRERGRKKQEKAVYSVLGKKRGEKKS